MIQTWGPVTRAGALALTGMLVFAHIAGQRVNNDAVFELDGNAVVDKGAGGHDWTSLNPPGNPPAKGTNGFQARAFFADGTSGQTIFTTGGSKDDLDITSWRHTNGSVPDKDDIVNAYASAYSICDPNNTSNCDLVLYFGLDRYANNGDSNAGFWFLQNGGSVDPNNAGRFTGTHSDHDILVLSTFTGGGQVSTIEILEWNPTYCQGAGAADPSCNITSNKTLRKLFPSGSVTAQCGPNSNEAACGIANSGTIAVDWTYQAKGGNIPAGSVPVASFFEGGVNLSHILGNAGVTSVPCFTNFLAETRSSSSEDATLKDFASGSFPVCGLQISKTCATCSIVQSGSKFRHGVSGTVTNTGFSTVYNVVVKDDAGTPSAAGDDLTFNVGSIGPGQTVNGGGGANDYFESLLNPASNTAYASGTADAAGLNPLATVDSGLVTCGTCPVNPSLTLGKTCTAAPYQAAAGQPVVIRIDYSGSVSNNGNVALSGVTVSEDHDGNGVIDIASVSLFKTVNQQQVACGSPCNLAPGETATFSGNYFPSVLTLVSPGRASFSDTVRASGTSTLPPTTTVNATPQSATCPICPPGSAACPAP